jgi:hypothetical protein
MVSIEIKEWWHERVLETRQVNGTPGSPLRSPPITHLLLHKMTNRDKIQSDALGVAVALYCSVISGVQSN